MGGVERGQSSRFQHYDAACIEERKFEESEGDPGGLSRARRGLKHHVRGIRNGPRQVVNYGVDGERIEFGVGQLRMCHMPYNFS